MKESKKNANRITSNLTSIDRSNEKKKKKKKKYKFCDLDESMIWFVPKE